MRKLSLLPALILALSLVAPACGGGGGDDDDDDIIVPDADTTPTPDAATTPTPDAAPTTSAANLGKPCGGAAMTACPAGEDCITLQGLGSTTEGFCTVPCTGQTDTVSCNTGYTGGGTPQCAVDDGMGGFLCLVTCTPMSTDQCDPALQCVEVQTGLGVCVGDE